ncbi:MAG: hypothetical protein JWR00_3809 [Rubritepida sp.]|nr:hypothetical protein [Rubritepida sp.]
MIRLHPILGRLRAFAGIADQIVISLANFAVGLVVLNAGTREEFGLYALAYMTVTMSTGFTGGMFGAQFTVAQHRLPEEERPAFAAALLLLLAFLASMVCLLLLGAAWVGGWAGLHDPASQTVLVTLLACPPAMALDFLRSHRLAIRRPEAALALDIVNGLLWVGASFLGLEAGLPIHIAAIGAFGAVAALTSLLATLAARLPLAEGARRMGEALRRVWDQGRWSVGGVAVAVSQNQGHFYLLGALAGAGAVAEVNAARMLVTPVALLMVGAYRTLIPTLAHLHATGNPTRAERLARLALLALLLAIPAYLLFLWPFRDLVSTSLLRGRYNGVEALVLLWALVLLLQTVTEMASAQLQAQSRFRVLTLRNAMTAVPVLAVLVPMILWLGGPGSLLTLAAGQAALGILLWREVRGPQKEVLIS